MNFADQRRAAAKRAAEILDSEKLPNEKGYGMSPTQYKGENNSTNMDIMDSGPKGTVVNKPNAAFKKHHPMSQQDTEYVEQKRYRE